MPKIYSMIAKGMIDVPDRNQGVKASDVDVITNGDPLKMAVRFNAYLHDSLQDATKKLERAQTALADAELRASKAESKNESTQQKAQMQMEKFVSDLSEAVEKINVNYAKLESVVQAIHDRPVPIVPSPVPSKQLPVPAINMDMILSAIRQEMNRAKPVEAASKETITIVTERDANGYIKSYVTKPKE